MEIIGRDNNLDMFLRSITGARVDIAVAFAGKTETVIDDLIANGNEVFLTIGTINYFSDPVFFRHCQQIAHQGSKLNLAIDFRGERSIHWKVYLASPNTVIIGSANLTTTGLAMSRDTAVRIEDKDLYRKYQKIFAKLRKTKDVIAHDDDGFEAKLRNYEREHRKAPSTRSTQNEPAASFSEWLARDDSQSLPLLIWNETFSREEREKFDEKIAPAIGANEFGATCYPVAIVYGKEYRLYHESEIILRVKNNGAHAKLERVNAIVKGDNESWWLCGIKGQRFRKPFPLTPELRKAIKILVPEFDTGKSFLDSNDLRQLENLLGNSS